MAGIGSMVKRNTAKMRHRITVYAQTETPDSSRQKVKTYTSARFTNEPATFEQVSGGEVVRGRQIESGVVAIFTVNYRSGYLTTDLVTFEGTNYGIHRIHKPEGIARFLELHCKAANV